MDTSLASTDSKDPSVKAQYLKMRDAKRAVKPTPPYSQTSAFHPLDQEPSPRRVNMERQRTRGTS